MVSEELVGRYEAVEGVHEEAATEANLPSVPLLQLHARPVRTAARRVVAVAHLPPVGLSHREGRRLGVVDVRQTEGGVQRDDAVEGCVPAAAPVALQKLVDAVQGASHGSRDDAQVLARGAQMEPVITQGARVRRSAQHAGRVPSRSQQDGFGRQRTVIRRDEQLDARHRADEPLELLRRVYLRGRGRQRPYNDIVGASVGHDGQGFAHFLGSGDA